jgi:transcriptional regulator with XRE-family HTH domain
MGCLLGSQSFAMIGAMNLSLDADVRAALQKRRGEWKLIAEQSKVSHSWISQFVRGKIDNPGYATLKSLAGPLGLEDKKAH